MREIDKKIEKVLIDHKFELAQHREQMSVEKYHFNLFNVVRLINKIELEQSKREFNELKERSHWLGFEITNWAILWVIILYLMFRG